MDTNNTNLLVILENLHLPEDHKIALLYSYYLGVLAVIMQKYPLPEEDIKKYAEEKIDILKVIAEKYPASLEDQNIITSIEDITQKFAKLLLSLADRNQKEKIYQEVVHST